MPIAPENRGRYPADWPVISREIRTVRAGGRCECDGRCGADGCPGGEGRCAAVNGRPHPLTGSVVVLTVAHLDHTPENCDPDNLMAACQRCHLAYDAVLHARSRRRATEQRWQAAGAVPLFDVDTPGAVVAESDSGGRVRAWQVIGPAGATRATGTLTPCDSRASSTTGMSSSPGTLDST